ncbi:hypothetical protein LLH00_02830 [bacterium]|nr:hypothetical protein [bacterium]
MKRSLSLAVLLSSAIILACSGQSAKTENSTAAEAAAPADSQPAASSSIPEPRIVNLMDHATIDTCDGEFEGYSDEKVADYNLTVAATVRVKVEHCKVTAITIVDSSHVNPAAARLIPQRIIDSQSLPVEAVAGASVASWTIMAATATALGIDLTELEDTTASAK